MARSKPPEFIGVLKSNDVGAGQWVTLVWRLDNGDTRLTREKAVDALDKMAQATDLKQLPLVDVDGNPI